MEKKDLRKLYKQKRKDLTSSEIEALEFSIYEQIFELDYEDITYVHIFLPIERQKEINTFPIIDFLSTIGKKLVLSRSDFETTSLQHFLFEETTFLEENEYGITEPASGIEIEDEDIDLIFVPMLVSDKKNYRVGYGKGFYDRFISKCRKDVKTIGLNFFEPIQDIKDPNEFDIPLQQVIYPK